jgi:hypothetical protein
MHHRSMLRLFVGLMAVLVAALAASAASWASGSAKADVRPEFTTQGGVPS